MTWRTRLQRSNNGRSQSKTQMISSHRKLMLPHMLYLEVLLKKFKTLPGEPRAFEAKKHHSLRTQSNSNKPMEMCVIRHQGEKLRNALCTTRTTGCRNAMNLRGYPARGLSSFPLSKLVCDNCLVPGHPSRSRPKESFCHVRGCDVNTKRSSFLHHRSDRQPPTVGTGNYSASAEESSSQVKNQDALNGFVRGRNERLESGKIETKIPLPDSLSFPSRLKPRDVVRQFKPMHSWTVAPMHRSAQRS